MTTDLLIPADTGQDGLPVLSWSVEQVPDQTDLLAVLPAGVADGELLAWVGGPDRPDSPALVGWGTAIEAVFGGPAPLAAAAAWWTRVCARAVRAPATGGGPQDAGPDAGFDAGGGPIAFVSAAFSPDSARGTLVRIPAVVLRRDAGTTTLLRCSAGDALPDRPVLRRSPLPAPAGPPAISDGELDGAGWSSAVSAVVEGLRAGAARKVVLARQLRARLPGDLDLRRPLRLLDRDYPSCWTYAVDGLFGATPELLAKRSGSTVTSRVLAGTVRREGDGTVSADALAHSAKDRDEHRIAAQSVAHVLRRRCTDVGLVGPRLLELPNVLHLATDLTATLAPGDRGAGALLSLAGDLHPTAAVGGTPRAAALALIAAAEGFDRGRYGAPVGWIDARGDGELGLALRCGQLDPDDPRCVTLYAGAGIVEGSDPAAELAETDAKFLPVIGALSG